MPARPAGDSISPQTADCAGRKANGKMAIVAACEKTGFTDAPAPGMFALAWLSASGFIDLRGFPWRIDEADRRKAYYLLDFLPPRIANNVHAE